MPFQAVVKVNGTPITMEIGMGASASIVSEETFKSLQSGQLKLDQASVRLFTYMGESITVVGPTQVTVEYNGQTCTLPLLVTQGNGPFLLVQDYPMTGLAENFQGGVAMHTTGYTRGEQ